jgi:hypothetical protein
MTTFRVRKLYDIDQPVEECTTEYEEVALEEIVMAQHGPESFLAAELIGTFTPKGSLIPETLYMVNIDRDSYDVYRLYSVDHDGRKTSDHETT